MEHSTCYSVCGIGDFDDSRSVGSLTTVPVSNRNQLTPEVSSTAKVPHNKDEKDLSTIGSDPSHKVAGSHHPSIFSEMTTSDDSEVLDPDLQAEMDEKVRLAKKEAKKEAKEEQRKRRKRKLQVEHEDQKKHTKRRPDDDDDDDDDDDKGSGKPPAAAAPTANPAVSAK